MYEKRLRWRKREAGPGAPFWEGLRPLNAGSGAVEPVLEHQPGTQTEP